MMACAGGLRWRPGGQVGKYVSRVRIRRNQVNKIYLRKMETDRGVGSGRGRKKLDEGGQWRRAQKETEGKK